MNEIDRLEIVDRLIERYNAGDADGYAAMLTEDGCEANYRGDVLRDGREGVRTGLAKMFAEFPENHAEVKARYVLGDRVVLHELVSRSNASEPFEVMSIYSFRDALIERVEFIR